MEQPYVQTFEQRDRDMKSLQKEEYMRLGSALLTALMFLASIIIYSQLPENILLHIITISVFFLLCVVTLGMNTKLRPAETPEEVVLIDDTAFLEGVDFYSEEADQLYGKK